MLNGTRRIISGYPKQTLLHEISKSSTNFRFTVCLNNSSSLNVNIVVKSHVISFYHILYILINWNVNNLTKFNRGKC